MTRREALRMMGAGFGSVCLAGATMANPLEAKAPHFTPKAKHVIFLFLNGGPSQVDTFDPKPALEKYHGKPLPGANQVISGGGIKLPVSSLMKSPFSFKKYGQCGLEASELFAKTGECLDDICVIRS